MIPQFTPHRMSTLRHDTTLTTQPDDRLTYDPTKLSSSLQTHLWSISLCHGPRQMIPFHYATDHAKWYHCTMPRTTPNDITLYVTSRVLITARKNISQPDSSVITTITIYFILSRREIKAVVRSHQRTYLNNYKSWNTRTYTLLDIRPLSLKLHTLIANHDTKLHRVVYRHTCDPCATDQAKCNHSSTSHSVSALRHKNKQTNVWYEIAQGCLRTLLWSIVLLYATDHAKCCHSSRSHGVCINITPRNNSVTYMIRQNVVLYTN